MAAAVSSTGAHLHQSVDNLIASSSRPYHIVQHQDQFQQRVLKHVADKDHAAMMQDPDNPLIVTDEAEAQLEYFQKLRTLYMEQETKRNFLAFIATEDPKTLVQSETEALERENALQEKEVQAVEGDIFEMRRAAIDLAKSNAARYAQVTNQVSEGLALQKKIRDLELELARIKATHPPEDRVTTSQANSILDDQLVQMQQLTDDAEAAEKQTETARAELSKTAKEVQRLAREREREEARAKEVQQGREAGDTKVDEMCRWLSSSISFYKTLMGIRSVEAISDHELKLEYDLAPESSNRHVALTLVFDPLTKRMIDARLGQKLNGAGDKLDITEAFNLASQSGDVPGFVADVLAALRSR